MDILRARIERLKTLDDSNAKKREHLLDLKDGVLDITTGTLIVSNVEFPCIVFNSIEERLLVKNIIMQDSNIQFKEDENSNFMGVFSGCENLTGIVFSKSLKVIGESMFENCEHLEKINLPESLVSIEIAGFNNCKRLKRVCLPQNVQSLEDECFANCLWLSDINLPKSLMSIGDYVFENCFNIREINIDKENPIYADFGCNIIANKQTKTLILGCKNSKIPNGVEIVGENAFQNCRGLKEIAVPSSVKYIEMHAFENCVNLCDVKIEEGLERIEAYAFGECKKLENINFPHSLKFVGRNAFYACESLQEIRLCLNINVKEPNWELFNPRKLVICHNAREYDFSKIRIQDVGFSSCGKGLVLRDYNGQIFYVNKNNDFAICFESELTKKNDEKRKNELDKLEIQDIHKILEWNKFDIVPHYTIVQSMPLEEIELFYKDNNAKNWYTLRKFANKKNGDITNEQRISLFALAHGIGIFSSSGKESEIATNFILENILNNYSLAELHQKVSGWDCNGVPYNSEFAKFFIKYFKEYDLFSARNSENEENISHYLSAVHNRFREIQNVFPYKKIQTRKKNEMLTPKLIIDAISRIQYANVAENCEKFSQTIKRFGYSQKEYDILQNWYLTGLKLKENYLNVNPDGTIFNIRYELLEKSNPLCAVLGNITNCCQVVNDSGKHCLRYGMTKPNSSFVVFKQNENIIGQAWIWYDEQNRQLTLDNIEIPYSYYVKVLEKGEYKQDLLNCIERFCKNIMQKMNEEQYYVDAVTIGLGYNKIAIDLIKKFGIIKNPIKLTDYANYTDANKQTLICKTQNSILQVAYPKNEDIERMKENELLLVY